MKSGSRCFLIGKQSTQMSDIISLVIFDLDGVLIESRDIHFQALNQALEEVDPKYVISHQEHLSTYDGLSTTKKLSLLTEREGLELEHYDNIWRLKQEKTHKWLSESRPNQELRLFFSKLLHQGISIAVASNSIRESITLSLKSLDVLDLVDFIVSNEDVTNPKPFPEMYWACMTNFKVLPQNTIIVEDSHIGRKGALNSGAHLFPVKDSADFYSKLDDLMQFSSTSVARSIKWIDKKMNVLIPMAGAGSRFAQANYTFPKPLIEVRGEPMIQVVVENLNIDAHYIFVVLKEHYEKYNLKQLLNLISPGCDIIQTDKVTGGAAITTLLAKELISSEQPLLIANSDQFVEWNSNECLYAFNASGIDGGIVTFEATHPKWSYAKLDDDGFVCEVAEKNPISTMATVGIYFWKKGSDYVKYAEQMIQNGTTVNGEFYVCPVFNEAIADAKKIRVKQVDKMWGLGTPEDLTYFLQNR